MHYEIRDLRDQIKRFEQENRLWPRSGSVSKPYPDDWKWRILCNSSSFSEADARAVRYKLSLQADLEAKEQSFKRLELVSDPDDGRFELRSFAWPQE